MAWEPYFNFIQAQEILIENSQEKKKKKRLPSQPFPRDSHVDVGVIRVRLCAGDLELLLLCGRHDKYSSWKKKARINLWIRAVRSICCLFVYLITTSYVLLLYLRRYSWVCSDTPPDDDCRSGTDFQYTLQKYMWKYRKYKSHSLAPHEKPCAWTVTSREIVAETA